MTNEDYNKLPLATPQYVVELARILSQTFKKPLNDARIDEALEHMNETWQIGPTTRREAKLILYVEQNPSAVVVVTPGSKFIASFENDRYQNIKQQNKKTCLADYAKFIAALIAKHGEDAEFYVDSDHGDEYFILKFGRD